MTMNYKRANMTVTYFANKGKTNDILLLKNRVLDEGTNREYPEIQIVQDFERQYYITKPAYRTHKKKKDNELIENCDMFRCTELALPYRVAGALNINHPRPWIRDLCNSPYVYGADIPSAVIYRNQLIQRDTEKNGSWVPEAGMAALDLEWDIDTGIVYMGTVSNKEESITVIDIAMFSQRYPGMEAKELELLLEDCFEKHVGDIRRERKTNTRMKIVNSPLEVILTLLKFTHWRKPDFLSIWNMTGDMDKILDTLSAAGVQPETVFSDPSIPKEYQSFRYNPDGVQKPRPGEDKAKAKKKNKPTEELWHVVTAPASFQVIDNMCLFARLRAIEQMRTSYGLSAIAEEIIGMMKLHFEEADHLMENSIEWHRYMVTHYPLEYAVYNWFDCVIMEILDEKTKDVSQKIIPYAGPTTIPLIKSNPTRLNHDFYFFLERNGRVPASVAESLAEPEFDSKVLGRKDWPVALNNRLTRIDAGYNAHGDYVELISRFYQFTSDVDITSGYPTGQRVSNASSSTTRAEICRIKGLTEAEHRRIAVNLTAVPANAVDIGQTVLGFPSLSQMTQAFIKARQDGEI